MAKAIWDKARQPSRWNRVADPQLFEKRRMEYRDVSASSIRVGLTLNGNLPVFLTRKQLSTHMHVLGSTNVGKSYYLEGIIKSLILQGQGVCVIDPHGDLYHRVFDFCAYVDKAQPERRLSARVIPFDISESKQIIGFNPAKRNARVMTYQVLALMESIRKVWGQDSFQATPRLARWLFNAAYAIVDASLTMVQMQYLVDPKPSAYRDAIVRQIRNPRIKAEWEWFSTIRERERNEFTESTLNRIQPFVIHEVIRQILGRQEQTLDFSEVLSGKKIVLVNLAKQNTIPEDYQHLLGTLLVNEILTAAFARAPDARHPFFLVVDEFSHFVTKDMCEILDGGRKFGLHLVLAHQHLNQLKVKDPEVYYSTMGNARTKAVFGGLIDEDLDVLAKEFFVGELNPDEIKDEIWQTKFRPVESSRIIRSDSWSESTGKSQGEFSSYGRSSQSSNGEVSHTSLSSGRVYIPGSFSWIADELQSVSSSTVDGFSSSSSRAESESSSYGTNRSSQTSETRGNTIAEVPWYESHEYKELSSRTFRDLEEQLYIKKAQLKRQPTQHAALLIPNQKVQLMKVSTIKDHPLGDSDRRQFRETCFELSGWYKSPEEADRESIAIDQKLLSDGQSVIEVSAVSDNPTHPKRGARSARKQLFAKLKKPS